MVPASRLIKSVPKRECRAHHRQLLPILTDPRVSDAEIRRQCLVALLGNENFRLHLIEWFLKEEPGNVHQRIIVSH